MSTAPKPYVFVLMPFHQDFDDIYKFGIKGAAEDAGAYAERVDEQIFTENMLDRIFNQINKADVIVADMSGRNPNVFYEVGYAHALGKIVLLLTQNADDIPFDLKHRPHIVYGGKIEKLRKELTHRIQWAIEESKKIDSPTPTYKLEVSINDKYISLGGVGTSEFPEVKEMLTAGHQNHFRVVIRNSSHKSIPSSSHMYLFMKSSAGIGITDIWSEYDPSSQYMRPSVGNFKALPLDAYDGLDLQFHLPIELPPLPVAAVETFTLPIYFRHDRQFPCKEMLRLRVVGDDYMFDYPFVLFAVPFDKKGLPQL